MKKFSRQLLLILFVSFYSLSGYAWNHSIELGYGYSQDPNHSRYNNSGFLLNGDLLLLWENPWIRWSIFGSVGHFTATSPINKTLTTAALDLQARVYPYVVGDCYPLYFFLASGPSVLSHRKFGLNTQAKNYAFQSNIGFGIELNHIDVNLRWLHYSNANLAKPNEGFNILYLLSIGYLF